MKAISEAMGSGLVKNVELSDVIEEDWCEYLTLDLKIKCSAIFTQGDNKFIWHCGQGICKSTMPLLNREFNLFRGLFPLKLFITGPPATGKTHFSTSLSSTYGLPHLRLSDIISAAYHRTDSLGDEIRKKSEELKDQVVADYEKTKKKKDPELDRATIKVRLPDEYLHRLVREQLNTAACKNKGFILDGYPRTMQDAKSIFMEHKEEEEADLYPGLALNKETVPQYTLVLWATDDVVLK